MSDLYRRGVQVIHDPGHDAAGKQIVIPWSDVRTHYDGYLKRTPGKLAERVPRLLERSGLWTYILTHPAAMKVCEDFFGGPPGEAFICSSFSGNTLYPGATRVAWHRDYPYLKLGAKAPDGLALQIVWCISEVTPANGATLVRWPDGTEEPLWGQPGTMIAFNANLYHTAGANYSDEPRSIVLATYCLPCIVPMEDLASQDAYASGHDDGDEVRSRLCRHWQPKTIGDP